MSIKVIVGTDVNEVEIEVNDLMADGYTFKDSSVTEFNGGSQLAFAVILASPETPNHDLTYNSNEGTGTIAKQRGINLFVKNSKGFTAPASLAFSKWNTKADGAGTDYDPGDAIELSKDTVLYAIWE